MRSEAFEYVEWAEWLEKHCSNTLHFQQLLIHWSLLVSANVFVYRYVQVILSYELVEMLHIATFI